MNSHDDEFNVHLGCIRNRGRSESFVNQVLRRTESGHDSPAGERRGRLRYGHSTFGRGRTAFGRSRLFAGQRHVVVKAPSSPPSGPRVPLSAAFGYIAHLERHGVTRDGAMAAEEIVGIMLTCESTQVQRVDCTVASSAIANSGR